MKMKNEIRCSIEFRADATRQSPGRLTGTLMQYEKRAGDRLEIFKQDSLEWDTDGIILNESHDRKQAIIRVVPENRNDEVALDIQLPDTQRGRDAAISIRNKTLRGLSVEFRAIAEQMVNGVRVISKAVLTAAGLVDTPSYEASTVQVRHRQQTRRRTWL